MRRWSVVVLLVGVWAAGLAPAAAHAATRQATCSGQTSLQTVLAAAAPGDTIVLTGLCTGLSLAVTKDNLTITGAASGTNGFDGTGLTSPALSGTPNGLTLSNLTFENYGATAVRLSPTNPSNPYTFTDDTFSHNAPAAVGSGGGLSLLLQGACTGASVTITNSTFDANSTSTAGGGGGGAYLESACSTAVTMTVDGSRFTNNSVHASTVNGANGGGLFVATGIRGVSTPALTLNQSGDVFSGNAVSGTGGSYAGGGEYTNGANLTSSGDGFINNTLPGPTASSGSSEGAGLATFGGGLCIVPTGVTSTASNLVAAGNTIGAPSSPGTGNGVEGAGVYIGCSSSGGGYHMTLINSTISGNAAVGAPANAVAGIDGESIDHLQLDNTIVAGDTGGSELAGFGIGGGSGTVAAEGSDVCAAGSVTTPFSGTGNICAAPLLVDPAHGDVHETATSPTLDIGVNGDAASLTTDYYGRPRLELGRAGSNSALVDAGASEFHPTAPTATTCSQIDALLAQAENGDAITIATMCVGGSFTIPADTPLTLQGAPGGTYGFDGVGASGEALHGDRSVGLTLRNLTIRNYTVGPTRSAVELQLDSGALPTIDHVQFLRNTSGGSVAGLLVNGFPGFCGLTGTLSLTNSTLADNLNGGSYQPSGGAAAIVLGCPARLVISSNQFTGNTVHAPASSSFGYGAGLFVANESGGQPVIGEQDHNTFRGNTIESTGVANSSYFGGGEAIWGVALTSTDDSFIDNTLPGPAGANGVSEGAGLGISDPTCGGPGTRTPTTAVNLAAAANTIGAPSSGGRADGAGVFAGCAFNFDFAGGPLTLVNATISGNTAADGIAGLAGQTSGALTLSNAIVAGNGGTGASDIGGFGIGGGSGSASVAYSDVCRPGTTGALPGPHNLCADPRLDGAAAGDVHETAASPTIDAGSNALVPAGLSGDAFGATRIFATKTCTPVVDMGAAEFGVRTAVCPPPPASSPKTVVVSITLVGGGVDVVLRCTGGGVCAGGVTMATTENRSGKRVVAVMNAAARHKVTVMVGSASYRLASGRRATLHLKLNATGRALEARFHKLPATVTVTQKLGAKIRQIAARKLTVGPAKRKH